MKIPWVKDVILLLVTNTLVALALLVSEIFRKKTV
jgi:hypothetical protein